MDIRNSIENKLKSCFTVDDIVKELELYDIKELYTGYLLAVKHLAREANIKEVSHFINVVCELVQDSDKDPERVARRNITISRNY